MKGVHRTFARRVAIGFALTTAASFALLTLGSSLLLRNALDREMEPALDRFFEGARDVVLAFEDDPSALERTVTEMLSIESPPPEGYRIWNRATGALEREFDPFGILREFDPLPTEPGEARRLDPGMVWYVGPLDDDRTMGALLGLLDLELALSFESREPERVALIERYDELLLGFLLVATTASLFVGWFLGARIGHEVERVRDERERTRLLTAGLAHELGAPVQNLLGEGEVALRKQRTAEEYRAVIESQVEEVRDLVHVLDNLVTFAAQGDAPADGEDEAFELGALLREDLDRERLESARPDVRWTIESAEAALRGDRAALGLALRNVLTNALRFSPQGGGVHLRARVEGAEVIITVDDDGPGVEPSDRERIFEPLVQGPSPGDERAGYGLGLALARRAVERHGGTITAGDAPGGGARFELRLPRPA